MDEPDHNPDRAAYADLCGAEGSSVTARDQLPAARARLFGAEGPTLMLVEQDAALS